MDKTLIDDNAHQAYVYAITEQTDQHIAGLDELSEKTQLTFNERSAAERSLQVLAEIAIGCSKHWLKANNKPTPSEARACIERVYESLSAATLPDISAMRGAIATRNVIVHDYLNLDWQRISSIVHQGKYVQIKDYIRQVSANLLLV
jgi:uncharacterized protein YutE (UPF0331/DUF86 family)